MHAELPLTTEIHPDEEAPREYGTFLVTRPPQMEISATQLLCRLANRHPRRCIHILNCSSGESLPLVEECRRQGGNLTVDTCPHYLALAAEDVPDCGTEFKTWPPIRERRNQERLWQALRPGGAIRMIGSDHSPATPGARALTCGRGRGNFLKAWPGINSLQLSLSVVWTAAANRRGKPSNPL